MAEPGWRLWGLSVCLVMMPWAIVLRAGDGQWGLVPSAIVAVLLLRFRRHRLEVLEAQERREAEGEHRVPSRPW